MAKKVKVQMSRPGMRKLLGGSEMRDAMVDVAKSHEPAGDGYTVIPGEVGGERTRALIGATTWRAYQDNARNATLLRSLEGG